MSLVDSSSDDDCYVNSAKILKAMKKKLVVTESPIEQEPTLSLQDDISPDVVEECRFTEAPLPSKPKRPRRRCRRNIRPITFDKDADDAENLPELFAKKKPVETISLMDSDPDDIIVTTIPDDPDTAGDEADENYEMTIKIKWQSIRLERVPLRRYQAFSTVFEYFSSIANVPQERIWLVLRNQITIQPSDTPDSLGITVLDIIEGGVISGNAEHQTVSTYVDKDSIIIKIQTKDQKKTLSVSLKKSQKIKVLMMKCAEQLKIPEDKIKFQFDGELVNPNETPESLDLEGGECFDMHTIP